MKVKSNYVIAAIYLLWGTMVVFGQDIVGTGPHDMYAVTTDTITTPDGFEIVYSHIPDHAVEDYVVFETLIPPVDIKEEKRLVTTFTGSKIFMIGDKFVLPEQFHPKAGPEVLKLYLSNAHVEIAELELEIKRLKKKLKNK